jgi:hypothetical protein
MDRNRMIGTGKSKGWLRRGGLWTAVAGLTVLATSGLGLSADAGGTSGASGAEG